jgi:hypothetical protein
MPLKFSRKKSWKEDKEIHLIGRYHDASFFLILNFNSMCATSLMDYYNWASQLLFHVGKPTKQQALPFALIARAYRRKKVSLVLKKSSILTLSHFHLVGKSLQEEKWLNLGSTLALY